MRTGVYYAVEVEIQVVHLFPVGICLCSINRILLAINLVGLLLDHRRDDLRVLFREPSEKSWDAHDARCLGALGLCIIETKNASRKEGKERRKEGSGGDVSSFEGKVESI